MPCKIHYEHRSGVQVPGKSVHLTAALFHFFESLAGGSFGSHCGDNTTSSLCIIITTLLKKRRKKTYV